MKKIVSLFLVFSVCALSMPLSSKEKEGADLIIQRTDGTQVREELIAVKENLFLLMERDSGADVSVEIKDVGVIIIVKKSKTLSRAGMGILVFGGSGALVGAIMRDTILWDRGTTIVVDAGVFAGIGALIGANVGAVAGIDKTIQVEGKSDSEIHEILEKLRKIARVKNAQ